MKLWRAIKYGVSVLFQRKKNPLHSLVEDWENHSLISRAWEKTAGFFYNLYEGKKEQYKIWRWGKSKDAEEERILFEVIQKSRKRLINFISIFLAMWGLDFVLQKLCSSTLSELLSETYPIFVQNFLGVMIGALTSFIALIFSLYGVLVQIVIQKHSTIVTKYINEDKFPNFFLRSLVIIDLFAIFLYIRGALFPTIPITISFLFLIAGIVYTMIALILLKDSYTYSIKPENLFARLGSDINDQIRIAAGYDKAVRDSRSVIHYSGERARELFDIFESLFEDLLREKNFKDISKVPGTLAFIFIEYLEKRKFIEDEQGWWFPKQLKLIKGDSMSTYLIKANYEMQGKGVLYMPVRNKEWFEQRTKALLNLLTHNISVVNEDTYTRAVLFAYRVILAGQPIKNEYDQYKDKVRGAYENGEIQIFKWFYGEFSRLSQLLNFDSDNVSFEFLNTLFAIGGVLLEENKEVLGTIEEFLKRIISHGQISATFDDLKKLNLPKNAHDLLCELFKGLKVEVICEGKVVTPTSSFTEEILNKLKIRYFQDAHELLTDIFTDVDKLICKLLKKKNYEICLRLIELEIRWFQRLVNLEKFELAIKHQEVLNKAYKYIVQIPVNETKKINLLDALELLIFPVAIANKKELFIPLSALLIFLLQYVYRLEQEPDQQLLLMRSLIVLGGFLYLVGEFEGECSLLEIYAADLYTVYPNITSAVEALESLKRVSGATLSGKIIDREITRYHHWFGVMRKKINKLPKTTLYQTGVYAGMSKAADHPSDFIKKMSVDLLFHEDECTEGFIKWLKVKYPSKDKTAIEKQVKDDINLGAKETESNITSRANKQQDENIEPAKGAIDEPAKNLSNPSKNE